MLKYVLLGFLNYRRLTGYDLKQVIDHSTAYFWYATQSQIYRTLKELEAAGQVRSSLEPQDSRPDRRFYTITDEGREELQGWLRQLQHEISPKKDALLLKVFFSDQVDKDLLLAQLRLHKQFYEDQQTYFAGELKSVLAQEAEESPGERKIYLLWDATRRFGELYSEMYARWLAETIQRIEEDL